MNPAELAWYAKPFLFGLSIATIWLVIGPIVSAVLAAIATHVLTRRRDRENFHLRLEEEAKIASRQIRREKLLSAYRALDASEPERVKHRQLGPDSEEWWQLERARMAALSDVNLFGDEKLASELDLIVRDYTAYDTSRIMNDLRDLLRSEFGLEKTVARYKWVDVGPRQAEQNNNGSSGESVPPSL